MRRCATSADRVSLPNDVDRRVGAPVSPTLRWLAFLLVCELVKGARKKRVRTHLDPHMLFRHVCDWQGNANQVPLRGSPRIFKASGLAPSVLLTYVLFHMRSPWVEKKRSQGRQLACSR